MKRICWVCLLVFALVFSWSAAIAEDFYVIPVKGKFTSWDKKILGSTRFKLVPDGDAVLDRETGLVWEKSPYTVITYTWSAACDVCYNREVANRKGWRLPAVEELSSLVDNNNVMPSLHVGYPFTFTIFFEAWETPFWSSTTRAGTTEAWSVDFSGGDIEHAVKTTPGYVWCVRGGYGHDGY